VNFGLQRNWKRLPTEIIEARGADRDHRPAGACVGGLPHRASRTTNVGDGRISRLSWVRAGLRAGDKGGLCLRCQRPPMPLRAQAEKNIIETIMAGLHPNPRWPPARLTFVPSPRCWPCSRCFRPPTRDVSGNARKRLTKSRRWEQAARAATSLFRSTRFVPGRMLWGFFAGRMRNSIVCDKKKIRRDFSRPSRSIWRAVALILPPTGRGCPASWLQLGPTPLPFSPRLFVEIVGSPAPPALRFHHDHARADAESRCGRSMIKGARTRPVAWRVSWACRGWSKGFWC